jgi:hypothetical protein
VPDFIETKLEPLLLDDSSVVFRDLPAMAPAVFERANVFLSFAASLEACRNAEVLRSSRSRTTLIVVWSKKSAIIDEECEGSHKINPETVNHNSGE